jgi:hypothetical protein
MEVEVLNKAGGAGKIDLPDGVFNVKPGPRLSTAQLSPDSQVSPFSSAQSLLTHLTLH